MLTHVKRRTGERTSMLTILCLSAAIYYEARNQPVDGQLAVAEVIMNRVQSDRYPDDACEVINQNKQFSYTHDGKSDDFLKEPEQEAVISMG
jgi:spore germination cell wall hydrolase CwlJ-like protein